MQAGCRRFDSVRLHHHFFDLIGKRLRFPVQSDACSGKAAAFTSFREIISVVGRTRVGVRWFARTNGGVVQVKYTNQVFVHRTKAGIVAC